MKAEDQFHLGIVVDDFEGTLRSLSELFGYEWCSEIAITMSVTLPSGDIVVDNRFTYSATAPRLEIIQSIPGTPWVPAGGVHHIGYWSDDVAADSAELERRGFATEATGRRPDGAPHCAYHRDATGMRIEIVSRSAQPGMEQYWANGKI